MERPMPVPDEADKPVVLVKRTRHVLAGDRVGSDGQVGPTQSEEPRGPKTYRIEAVSSDPGGDFNVSAAASSGDDARVIATEPDVTPRAVPRKARRKRHGEVTIIRPSRSEQTQAVLPSTQVQTCVARRLLRTDVVRPAQRAPLRRSI